MGSDGDGDIVLVTKSRHTSSGTENIGNSSVSSDNDSAVEGTGSPRRYSKRIKKQPCDGLVFIVDEIGEHVCGSVDCQKGSHA